MTTSIKLKLLALVTVAFICLVGMAQTPPPKPTNPTTYKLNAEASTRYLDIEKTKAELFRAYKQLEAQQEALLIGADIPASERDRPAKEVAGVVTFPPKPPPPPTKTNQ